MRTARLPILGYHDPSIGTPPCAAQAYSESSSLSRISSFVASHSSRTASSSTWNPDGAFLAAAAVVGRRRASTTGEFVDGGIWTWQG